MVKHRFLAAQMLAWLDGGLWLQLARHANAAAAELAAGLQAAGLQPMAPVQSNEIFLRLPRATIARLRKAGLRAADWPTPGDDAEQATIRLVTSWATREDEIAALLGAL